VVLKVGGIAPFVTDVERKEGEKHKRTDRRAKQHKEANMLDH